MKIYALSSYSDCLNDTELSLDYDILYQKMKVSYEMTLKDIAQTEEEKEITFITGYHAVAVVHQDWVEWRITEQEISDVRSEGSSGDYKTILTEIIRLYQENDVCLGEFISGICVSGLSLEDSLTLLTQLFQRIDGRTLVQIE